MIPIHNKTPSIIDRMVSAFKSTTTGEAARQKLGSQPSDVSKSFPFKFDKLKQLGSSIGLSSMLNKIVLKTEHYMETSMVKDQFKRKPENVNYTKMFHLIRVMSDRIVLKGNKNEVVHFDELLCKVQESKLKHMEKFNTNPNTNESYQRLRVGMADRMWKVGDNLAYDDYSEYKIHLTPKFGDRSPKLDTDENNKAFLKPIFEEKMNSLKNTDLKLCYLTNFMNMRLDDPAVRDLATEHIKQLLESDSQKLLDNLSSTSTGVDNFSNQLKDRIKMLENINQSPEIVANYRSMCLEGAKEKLSAELQLKLMDNFRINA